MSSIGILAYGSLVSDPGVEIEPVIVHRIATTTPFGVEYGRYSRGRGGGPTVVPHTAGGPVSAQVLQLAESVALEDAKGMLWRREVRQEGSRRPYSYARSPDAVIVQDSIGFCGLEHVLYTDFNPAGKIAQPDPEALADAAIRSVASAKPGRDGISYLIDLSEGGVATVLTAQYVAAILGRAGTSSLIEAREVALRRAAGLAS